MRRWTWVLLALLFTVSDSSAATKPPPPRFHVTLSEVHAVSSAPAEITLKTRNVFQSLLAARPDFARSLEGAPDAKARPDEMRRFLESRGLRAFTVELKVDEFVRSLAPDEKPGSTGQILTIKIGVSLLGTQIPDGTMALAGSGGSTIIAEVGKSLKPREEEATVDDALRDALTQAVDDAVAKLSARGKKPSKSPSPPTSQKPKAR